MDKSLLPIEGNEGRGIGGPGSNAAFPLISVVVPSYNQAQFIGEAIQSCLDQDYPNKEVIAVDVGSSDKSLNVIAEFGPHVRLVRSTSRVRVGAARNIGYRASRGEFHQFLDGDDVLLPSKLTDQYEIFQADPSLDVVFGIQRNVPNEKVREPSNRCNEAISQRERTEIEFCRRLTREMITYYALKEHLQASCFLFRRSALENYGLFNEDLGTNEDNELAFRHAIQGAKVRFCPTITNIYRQYQAPGRMTAASEYHKYCLHGLNVMLAFAMERNQLTNPLRKSFAQELWRYSWDAVAKGDTATAQEMISRAKQLNDAIFGPWWFRRLAEWLPPIPLQRAALAIRCGPPHRRRFRRRLSSSTNESK